MTKTTGNNVRREDLYGRPIKAQSYEILVATHERIKDITKEFKVTAPELLEVLMERTDWNAMGPHLQAVRAKKEAARAKALENKKAAVPPEASQIASKLKDLTPEQLAKVKAIIGA